MEGLLEVSQILAYVSLALISLVVATFAISVSYLGRETHQSLWRKKRRRAELEKKLKELIGKTTSVQEMKREIDDYEKEIRELDERLSSLSVAEAVAYPSALGLTALFFSLINLFLKPPELYAGLLVFCAAVSDAGGGVFLLRTLYAVDWVASRIPLPKFSVFFRPGTTIKESKAKEEELVGLCVHNIGEEMAENLQIFAQFPPAFSIREDTAFNYKIVPQDETTDYPGYNAAVYEVDRLHTDIIGEIGIRLKMPKEAGSYIIPVDIRERRIGESKHELTIRIVEGKQTE